GRTVTGVQTCALPISLSCLTSPGSHSGSCPVITTQSPGTLLSDSKVAATRKASAAALGPPLMPKLGPCIRKAWLMVPETACSERSEERRVGEAWGSRE